MAEFNGKKGHWVTTDTGSHVFIESGKSFDEAVSDAFGKENVGKYKKKKITVEEVVDKMTENGTKEVNLNAGTIARASNGELTEEEVHKWFEDNDELEDYEAFDDDNDFENWDDEEDAYTKFKKSVDGKYADDLIDTLNLKGNKEAQNIKQDFINRKINVDTLHEKLQNISKTNELPLKKQLSKDEFDKLVGEEDFEHKNELTTTVNTLLKEGKNKEQIKNYLKQFGHNVTYTDQMDKYVDKLVDAQNEDDKNSTISNLGFTKKDEKFEKEVVDTLKEAVESNNNWIKKYEKLIELNKENKTMVNDFTKKIEAFKKENDYFNNVIKNPELMYKK